MSEVLKSLPDGHSLIVNAIDPKAGGYALEFIKYLTACGGLDELMAVSLYKEASPQATKEIQDLLKRTESGHPFWRHFLNRPAQAALAAPLVIGQDTQEAVKTLSEISRQQGDSARLMLHFMTYDRRYLNTTQDIVAGFKNGLPEIEQRGVLIIPHGNILEQTYFRKSLQTHPPRSLGIPLIYADREPDSKAKLRSYGSIGFDRALIIGLAGLVANKQALPFFNNHHYLELFQALTEQSSMIGVSIGMWDEVYKDIVKNPTTHNLDVLLDSISVSIDESSRENNSLTSLVGKGGESLEIAAVQLPVSPDHKLWKDHGFMKRLEYRLADKKNTERPLILSLGYNKTVPQGRDRTVTVVAARFYPLSP